VTIPLVGYLFTFLDTPIGYVLFIGVPFGLLVLSELWSFARTDRDGGTATVDAESTTDPDSTSEARSVEASANDGSSGVTVTRRDLRVLLPVTVFFGLYTVWNAIQSPGSTVHVGVAAAMVLLSVFLVVLYLSLGGSSTGRASPTIDRSTIGIRIDGSIDDSAGYTDGSDSVRVASIRELAVLAQEEGRPIAVDDGLRWYQVRANGDRYLYDAGGARMPIEADVLGEPGAENAGGSAHTLEGDR
jgi:signal peptidase